MITAVLTYIFLINHARSRPSNQVRTMSVSVDAALAGEIFDHFCNAGTLKSILRSYRLVFYQNLYFYIRKHCLFDSCLVHLKEELYKSVKHMSQKRPRWLRMGPLWWTSLGFLLTPFKGFLCLCLAFFWQRLKGFSVYVWLSFDSV